MDQVPGTDRGSSFIIPGAIVLAGVIIAAAVLYVGGFGRGAPGTPAPSGSQSASAAAALANIADDDPSLGNPNAPVTLVEFGDFQCPFCNRFFREAERDIIETYVKTGKARFVYRDLTILGPESVAAAEAAECAHEQGKFWAYHDRLYNFIWDTYFGKNQSGENVGAFANANLQRFAADVGLDVGRFNECAATHRYQSEVERDTADGRAAGAMGTPTVFINGKMFVGALPFSQFQSAIEEALLKK